MEHELETAGRLKKSHGVSTGSVDEKSSRLGHAKPDITLSVVSHGQFPLLDRLLRQLAAEPTLAGVPVVITLNLPDEDLDPAVYAPLAVRVIRNPTPKGFGANHNAAFRHCQTVWFGVLNPDLMLCGPEPFSAVCQYAEHLPDVGVVAPMILGDTGLPEDAVRPNLTPWSLLDRHLLGHRELPRTAWPARSDTGFFWLAGMCLVLSSAAFRAVEGFDERYFLYCEDYDLCARLYEAGYSLARDPRSSILHAAQRDSFRSRRHFYWHLTSLGKVWVSKAFWRITARETGQVLRRRLGLGQSRT